MKIYKFVVKLDAAVEAKNSLEAMNQLNAQLDQLGKIDPIAHYLSWDDAEWVLLPSYPLEQD